MGYIGLPQGKVNNPCCGSPKADVSVGDHQGEELLRPLVLSLDSSRDMFLFLKSISLPSLPVIPVLPSGVTKDTCLPSSLWQPCLQLQVGLRPHPWAILAAGQVSASITLPVLGQLPGLVQSLLFLSTHCAWLNGSHALPFSILTIPLVAGVFSFVEPHCPLLSSNNDRHYQNDLIHLKKKNKLSKEGVISSILQTRKLRFSMIMKSKTSKTLRVRKW